MPPQLIILLHVRLETSSCVFPFGFREGKGNRGIGLNFTCNLTKIKEGYFLLRNLEFKRGGKEIWVACQFRRV